MNSYIVMIVFKIEIGCFVDIVQKRLFLFKSVTCDYASLDLYMFEIYIFLNLPHTIAK